MTLGRLVTHVLGAAVTGYVAYYVLFAIVGWYNGWGWAFITSYKLFFFSHYIGILFAAIALIDGVKQMLRGPTPDVFGSARFATQKETANLVAPEGLIIGRNNDKAKPDLLRYNGQAHVMTIAPTRSGKGVSSIIPNLLSVDRSMLIVDPKGENAKITARARAKFGKVFILDPFEISGKENARYNPLSSLDANDPNLIDEVNALTDAIIYDPPSQVKDAHWNEEAKALLSGLLLFCVCHEETSNRTLGTVRGYLSLGSEKFSALMTLMSKSDEANGLIARSANRFSGKNEKEAASILSTAQRHTNFLDSPRIDKSTSKSDFSFDELKTGRASVFLVLPPDRIESYARWLRLIISQALSEIAKSNIKPSKPILFMLDEFAALGYLSSVERAMGLMAGYGIQLWPILQDMHQLRSTYGERAGSFLSNIDVLQTFGTKDHQTATMLSNMMGQTTVSFVTEGTSKSINANWETSNTTSQNTHLSGRALATADEIMTMDAGMSLLFVKGTRPIPAARVIYYRDKEFSGAFDQA